MKVLTILLPLLISKVGVCPSFSTHIPYCRTKSSKAFPLALLSGPYNVLCAFVSIPIMTGNPFVSIISMSLSSHAGCTSQVMSRYRLTITVCFPFTLVRATAQSWLHQLSMAVRLTSRLATIPALGRWFPPRDLACTHLVPLGIPVILLSTV